MPVQEQDTSLVVYKDASDREVSLSKNIVKRYLCQAANDQEMEMFLRLCQYQRLNPFLREVYLLKYGNQPATMVVGWHVFLKRAEGNPNFDGYDVEVYDEDDAPYRGREGQNILYATAKIYRKDRKHATVVTVLFDEYAQRDANGTLRSSWAKMSTTMIRKVALEQGLRESFTKDFEGLYGFEEMGQEQPARETIVANVRPLSEPEYDPELAPDHAPEDVTDTEPDEPEAIVEHKPLQATKPVMTPFAAVAKLATLYGPRWASDPGITKQIFGEYLKSVADMNIFMQRDPSRWATGTQALQDALHKSKPR
jgi:phage recombination protein Bet